MKDLLGLEGESRDAGAGETREAGISYIRDVDDYGRWGHGEIEAISEVQVHGDLGTNDDSRVERWADSGDAGDGEWGERDLGQGNVEGSKLLGGCYRAVEFDVSSEGIEMKLEEAACEEVDNFLRLVDEAWAAGGLLSNSKFALSHVDCALYCTVLATEGDSMWPNAQLEVASTSTLVVLTQRDHEASRCPRQENLVVEFECSES